MTAHKHAELMLQYAQDALETEVLRVKEYIGYEPETGRLFWKKKRGNKHTGQTAGSVDTHGHVRIELFGKTIGAHRAAWIVATGHNPLGVVDHINGDPADNRIVNLREATMSENLHNQRRAHKHNKTGILGVQWRPSKNKFRARIVVSGKEIHLGHFDRVEDAQKAYLDAKAKLHDFAPK